MYKTITVNEDRYRELQKISAQVNKPKTRIVESLVKEYGKRMQRLEKERLERFNKTMGAKVKALCFTKKIKVDTKEIDSDFATLADTDLWQKCYRVTA